VMEAMVDEVVTEECVKVAAEALAIVATRDALVAAVVAEESAKVAAEVLSKPSPLPFVPPVRRPTQFQAPPARGVLYVAPPHPKQLMRPSRLCYGIGVGEGNDDEVLQATVEETAAVTAAAVAWAAAAAMSSVSGRGDYRAHGGDLDCRRRDAPDHSEWVDVRAGRKSLHTLRAQSSEGRSGTWVSAPTIRCGMKSARSIPTLAPPRRPWTTAIHDSSAGATHGRQSATCRAADDVTSLPHAPSLLRDADSSVPTPPVALPFAPSQRGFRLQFDHVTRRHTLERALPTEGGTSPAAPLIAPPTSLEVATGDLTGAPWPSVLSRPPSMPMLLARPSTDAGGDANPLRSLTPLPRSASTVVPIILPLQEPLHFAPSRLAQPRLPSRLASVVPTDAAPPLLEAALPTATTTRASRGEYPLAVTSVQPTDAATPSSLRAVSSTLAPQCHARRASPSSHASSTRAHLAQSHAHANLATSPYAARTRGGSVSGVGRIASGAGSSGAGLLLMPTLEGRALPLFCGLTALERPICLQKLREVVGCEVEVCRHF